ncbi:MAG TPA: four helix bundle protein [Rubrobacter sp.]|nr:four helix bundle protein [Rubrobacter sp.]
MDVYEATDNFPREGLSELEYHLLLARDLDHLDSRLYRNLSRRTEEVKRMLSTFITKLRDSNS